MSHFSPLACSILIFLVGCANSPKPAVTGQNEFLNEYSFEKAGEDGNFFYSYWNRHVNWRAYDKILVEPVVIDVGPESQLKKMDHADRVQLQEYVEACLREEMSGLFKLATHPGPNTLRAQLTLVDALSTSELSSMMAYLHPSSATMTGLQTMLTTMKVQGLKADLKGQVTDSSTGDLLMAAANAKDDDEPWDGARSFDGGVQALVRIWVGRFSLQLCQHQGLDVCSRQKTEESAD